MATTISNTPRTIIYKHESHKLHHEGVAAVAFPKGTPVKLTTTGTLTPVLAADDFGLVCVGVSVHDATIGQRVTYASRGYLIITMRASAAALPAGPVVYSGTYTDPVDGAVYGLAATGGTAVTSMGWALGAGVAQYDDIKVLIQN